MITAASAAAQKLGLKVSTSAILWQDLVHKAGQRQLGAAFGSTVQRTEDGQDLVHKAGQRHFGAAVSLTVFIAAYLNGKLSPG